MLDLIPEATQADDDADPNLSVDPTRRVSRVASDVSRGSAPLLIIAGQLKEMVPPFDFVYAESEPSKTALRSMIVSWLHKGYLIIAVSDVKTFSLFERIADILKSRIYVISGLPLLESDPVLRTIASGYDAVPYLDIPAILTVAKPPPTTEGASHFEALQADMRSKKLLNATPDTNIALGGTNSFT